MALQLHANCILGATRTDHDYPLAPPESIHSRSVPYRQYVAHPPLHLYEWCASSHGISPSKGKSSQFCGYRRGDSFYMTLTQLNIFNIVRERQAALTAAGERGKHGVVLLFGIVR